jgi:kynurenine formamidase
MQQFVFSGKLVTVTPEKLGEDLIVTLASVQPLLPPASTCSALVIRTLPNGPDKQTRDYSGQNPPYLEAALAEVLISMGIDHLLVDLPSVDKESDDGALAFHKTFWQVRGPGALRPHATLTELIYVPNEVEDGFYRVFIAPARWRLDAAPSRVWLASSLPL